MVPSKAAAFPEKYADTALCKSTNCLCITFTCAGNKENSVLDVEIKRWSRLCGYLRDSHPEIAFWQQHRLSISHNFLYALYNFFGYHHRWLPVRLALCSPNPFDMHRIRSCKEQQISFTHTHTQNTFQSQRELGAVTHLANSYCRIVTKVSSMVLLHNVLTDDTKKVNAFNSNSPFLVRLRCVSELYRNSCCSSGLFWANSENASDNDCCVWTIWWKWELSARVKRRICKYFRCVSRNWSICASNSESTVRVDLPNFSSINCRVHLYVEMLQFFRISIFETLFFKNVVDSPLNVGLMGVGVVGANGIGITHTYLEFSISYGCSSTKTHLNWYEYANYLDV